MKKNELTRLSYADQACQVYWSIIIVTGSSLLLLMNQLYAKYPGNHYFPNNFISTTVVLLAITLAINYCVYNNYIRQFIFSIFCLNCLMSVMVLATSAVQLTPFSPIDTYIVATEHLMGLDLANAMAWVNQHLMFKKLLNLAYLSLVYQISLIPILIAVFGDFSKLNEYICLFLISILIGFTIYYFFPTMAPSSLISSPFFTLDQYATSLKFKQVHHYISPTTAKGGLIAFPSFHVIWSWFCVYIVRDHWFMLLLLIPLNSLLVLSCVLLGWHYFLDILASGAVIVLSHKIYRYAKKIQLLQFF